MSAVALRMEAITKSFDGFLALDEAEITVGWGELHALLGENGAGKSSLMNVACGLYLPDKGRIVVDGQPVQIEGPAHARALRIGMVHQHFKLVRPFTVAENVMLANPRGSWRRGLRAITAEIERHGRELGFAVDPRARIDAISVAEQQRVEILKGLIGGARILILDEPTAVLTDEEADRLLATARGLARRGACVILITHKLREVLEFADRVTVMRAGRSVAAADPSRMTAAELARLTVGDAPPLPASPARAKGAVQMQVTDLVAMRPDGARALGGASFEVRAGEIYGIAGVGGNGQTELAEALMGVRLPDAGRVLLAGRDVTFAHPRRRRRLGLAAIAADRYSYGLAGDLSVADNFGIAGLQTGRYGGPAWVQRSAMRSDAEAAIRTFALQGARPALRAALLSGGNAQKLVLARELSGEAKVVVAHSPTRGLDVRSCLAVHDNLRRARDRGAAVLLISEDLDEVMGLSDRIGVMNRGRIVAEFASPADRHAVGAAMVGHA